MDAENEISGLCRLAAFIRDFLQAPPEEKLDNYSEFSSVLTRAEIENPWFTQENLLYALEQWSVLLTREKLETWLSGYRRAPVSKKVGLVLAGNIPMVGFHDLLCVLLSGHRAIIKPSSKDKVLLPFLLKKWNEFTDGNLQYEFKEKLEGFDAVIATGSNNTARYLEYYFKDYLSIIRKNRTSIAVLSGEETPQDLKNIAEDIFRYFGLGCRNVTRIFLPENYQLNPLFESFLSFKDVINHHKYANNYDYNRAIFLLNQEKFWENGFVLLKEDDALFSPLAVVNFSRYSDLSQVEGFIAQNQEQIQAVVSKDKMPFATVAPGESQKPGLAQYADDVDTMRFLEVI